MKRRIITLILLGLLTACVMIVMLSCGDDECPTCPEPKHVPDYHVLYSYVDPPEPGPYSVVLEYSLKYGTVVDSTYYTGNPFEAAAFSPDGEYSCYTKFPDQTATWVTNTRTGDTVAISHGTGGYEVDVSGDGQYALVSLTKYLTIMSLPDLRAIHRSDSATYSIGAFHPSAKKVFYTKQGADSLYALTFNDTGIVTMQSSALRSSSGLSLYSLSLSVSPDGGLVVLDARLPSGNGYILVLNSETFELIHQFSLSQLRAHLRHAWHPDGKRVFLPYNGGFQDPYYGGIDVYDISTGVFQSFITSDEISIEPSFFQPSRIMFTPSGETMVVLSGTKGFARGPILVFDMASKLVTWRFNHQSGSGRAIGLIPIDWEKEE